MTLAAPLHAVRSLSQVTAPGALDWFSECEFVTADPGPGGGVIGYLLAADRADWFRCAGPVPHGPTGPRELAGAFEVFATAGSVQLRWVHEADGLGWAVSLSEDPAVLPAGQPLAGGPERRRRPGTVSRLLAGRVVTAGDGWATLATARYAPCDVPVNAARDQEVWAELAEYAVSDEHGNLSVTDTLLLSLTARSPEPSGKERRR